MSLILPFALLIFLFRERIRQILKPLSLPFAFILSGIVVGLLTETFAILSNLDLPYAERALLSPYPGIDLILALFWYGIFVLLWYLLLKRYHYSYLEIFVLGGAYGIIFEQKGVFLPLLMTPQFIIPLFIMAVYSLFPICAYMLTKQKFLLRERKTLLVRYPIAIIALLAHAFTWTLFGLLYYPVLNYFGFLGHLQL